VGLVIAWGSEFAGFGYAGLTLQGIGDALLDFGFNVPLPAFDHVFGGFAFLGILLVTAIPFGIYDLVEATDNVESAAAAGDEFPTTRVVTADGVVSMIGCLMGNPFINAVYIGHPGWKAMGGRIGYSAVTGIFVMVLTTFGVLPLLLAVIPVVAILPILLYIGLLIGAQAFQESPSKHAPAIVLALVPHLAAWGKNQVDNALSAAGTDAAAVGFDALTQAGVLYHGLEVLGGGAILSAVVWSGLAISMIDRNRVASVSFAASGAVLAFFGLIHSEAVGWAVSPGAALAYVLIAALVAVSKSAEAVDGEPIPSVPAER
jgi:AGZA family xanthine/uracil permease-like MFS transporter